MSGRSDGGRVREGGFVAGGMIQQSGGKGKGCATIWRQKGATPGIPGKLKSNSGGHVTVGEENMFVPPKFMSEPNALVTVPLVKDASAPLV